MIKELKEMCQSMEQTASSMNMTAETIQLAADMIEASTNRIRELEQENARLREALYHYKNNPPPHPTP